ncbi:hypothetical protein EHS25_008737 [Saitozyma podzolica]|uniref:Uncharacterized protein n=1 Tax=Saitozyma podzolica TaxID=1890683 RepID=A0A427YMG9_9TREE|nr:hypothetical protein EHS25_008737 [Saitozyma podzolica]
MPVPPLPLPPPPTPTINALPDPVLDVVPGDLFAPELDFGDPPSSSELSGLAMYSPWAGTRLLAPWGRRAGGGVGVEGPAWFVERESRGGPDISARPAPPTGASGHESKWEGKGDEGVMPDRDEMGWVESIGTLQDKGAGAGARSKML